MTTYDSHYINGAWHKAHNPAVLEVHDSTTEEVMATVPQGTAEEATKAVLAARAAFPAWSALSVEERCVYIDKIVAGLKARTDEMGTAIAREVGMPIKMAKMIQVGGPIFNWGNAAKAARAFHWQEQVGNSLVVREPIGVVGCITPWNFPFAIPTWKIAPALATGNTVVLKPAETTPLTTLKLAEIIQEADLPPGVVNIITGSGETGVMLTQHPNINKIAFTGSTEVGKLIQATLAGTSKKLTLELGGKGANIIFEDAPIDQAVEGVINGIFFNQGHVCCAGSRLYVQESIAKTFIAKLKDRLATLRVGDPMDKNTDIGAINSFQQLKSIQSYIEIGKKEGASFYQSKCKIPNQGYFCPPILFSNVAQSSRIAQEEIFGPVLCILTFRTEDEVIEKANNTPYGLSAGVWTDKGARIFNLTKRLRAGVIWANTYNLFDPVSPFGGYKESGFGREGGLHGLYPYVQLS